jgi:D-tyrosyl-tRNA(Tyr) deacylase
MKALIQRVDKASVHVDKKLISSIKKGLLILLGFHKNDNESDAEYIINKILGLRIFDDADGVMNLSVLDTDGETLIVSQFTLYGDVKKGKRPSYSEAMKPDKAEPFYQEFLAKFETAMGKKIKSGCFGAYMEVSLVNSGPITIMVESPAKSS